MSSPSPFHQPPVRSASELHRQWLELVDIEGPFLAIPSLKRVWPNGIPNFRSIRPEGFEAFSDARKPFELAWEALDQAPENDELLASYLSARDEWVQTVLREVIGWAELLEWGAAGLEVTSPDHVVTASAQAALVGSDGIGALVHVVDPTDSLRQTPKDGWAATPVDRLEALLRKNDVEIGIVTDGRWWALVSAGAGRMAASGIIDALTWVEEPRTRDAFFSLADRQHLVGGDPDERLPVLFEESVAAAEEITEALGAQVRRAVELLIQSFSESAAEAKRLGQPDPLPARPHDAYEAAVTAMMRTVFLLFAEERGLLPSGELFDQGYGISHELSRLSIRESDEGEEALDGTSLTWHRLLATSRALFNGASFESLRMPAYGGSLFDPTRFPFLSATNEHGGLAIAVSDRVMLHVLRSVQVAAVKGDARQISFRDIDVEQIGYIYEGLLGYTCAAVNQTYLGLIGTTGSEPEIPLAKLEQLGETHTDPKALAKAIRDWIAEDQPSAEAASVAKITKSLKAKPEPQIISALAQTVGEATELSDRITPWLGIVRSDLRARPFVVLEEGLLVHETPSRKNAGAHYTPKSLAQEVVLHTLQPLCYSPGPHQTLDEADWKLRSSDELLDLKVADIACGSGAFLVAASRYLADRVVEAWISEDPTNKQRKDLYTRAMRKVVATCLYGADINDMAVEMCKLSLWLVSLDRDLPFSFVDDKVFVGNSLLGLTDLRQIRKMHIDPSRVSNEQQFDLFEVDIDAVIRKAVDLRDRLATEVDQDDPARTSVAKQRQLTELRRVTATLRQIADGVVAAGLPLEGKPGRALDDAYDNLRLAVKQAHPAPGEDEANQDHLNRILKRGLTPIVETDSESWQPLHWILEAPDVLVEYGGFDAVIGNPPFLAGKKIARANGTNLEKWMKLDLQGQRGSADLCAHFIRRAWLLLADQGSLGLIATDRIGQGDTAAMSTAALGNRGLLYRAVSRFRWPGAASTGAAIVWIAKLPESDSAIRPNLDGKDVTGITPSLTDASETDVRLASKLTLPFLAGNGVAVYGTGFILEGTDPILASLPEGERANLRPFTNGKSLMSGLPSDRWAIDVGKYETEPELFEGAPILAAHLRRLVKPVRDGVTSQVHEHRFWAFWDKREDLMDAINELDQFIVLAKDTRVPVFTFTNDHKALYSDKVILISSEDPFILGVLSSAAHTAWFERTRTGRGKTSSYIVSRCLRTYPFPSTEKAGVRERGLDFESARSAGITKDPSLTLLYNKIDDPAVRDPSINAIRDAQCELDAGVFKAYGWDDLDPDYGFVEIAGVRRFGVTESARNEIRGRLLEQNAYLTSESLEKIPGRRRRGSQADSSAGGTLF